MASLFLMLRLPAERHSPERKQPKKREAQVLLF
jgi:hypothetical protein